MECGILLFFRKMMSLGQSRPWQEALKIITGGESEISAKPLLAYYQPLIQWLEEEVERNDIPIGWDFQEK